MLVIAENQDGIIQRFEQFAVAGFAADNGCNWMFVMDEADEIRMLRIADRL